MTFCALEIESFAGDETVKETLAEIGRLRVIAWRSDGEMPIAAGNCSDVWLDEHDLHAHHWIVKIDGVIVAAARLCLHDNGAEIPDCLYLGTFIDKISFPAAFINRLVVHPSSRRKNLSQQLDDARIEFAVKHGAKVVIAATWNPLRVTQLQSHGWEMLGESTVRFVTRAPNYVFIKKL
jgi:predicted GNAT family N-acyltransferase